VLIHEVFIHYFFNSVNLGGKNPAEREQTLWNTVSLVVEIRKHWKAIASPPFPPVVRIQGVFGLITTYSPAAFLKPIESLVYQPGCLSSKMHQQFSDNQGLHGSFAQVLVYGQQWKTIAPHHSLL
jgi:hypothetical protein